MDTEKLYEYELKDISKRLSKSKILTFKDCPKKYFMFHHFQQQEEKHPAMIRGIEIHDLLDNLYEEKIDFRDSKQMKDTLLKLSNN